ncbi:hypothetical protein QZH56_35390 [Streptomyces olivoreticuli]|uniref:hypothetical protein n=1 Tax=Streptomyces olivoreticuli TaxID=68246 RepID=UPI0026591EBA|nr:hypothetical protein [Streptomyces olivoreticuli]WKK23915.1 hypothetical protein QZH56_35390 [Streptomyces olivoreticuli]
MTGTEYDGDLRIRQGNVLEQRWSTDRATLERLWDALHRLELPDPPTVVLPETHHVPLPSTGNPDHAAGAAEAALTGPAPPTAHWGRSLRADPDSGASSAAYAVIALKP